MELDNETKQAITNVINQLENTNAQARTDAAKKLGGFGIAHPKIIERLQSLSLNDISTDVQDAAKLSLQLLQTPTKNSVQNNEARQTQMRGEKSEHETMIALLQKQNEILENLRSTILYSAESQSEKKYQFRTRVVDFDLSIGSMIVLTFKWFIASIPIAIILFFLGSCFAALSN